MRTLGTVDVHLRDLRYFVAVAEELHFTRAAQREFVSQPVLSRQVARLEADLRVTLLERTRRSVALTPAGEELLVRARVLLDAWGDAERAVGDIGAQLATTLRIGVQTSVGRGLIQRFTTALHERRPTWSVDVAQINWSDPSAGVAGGQTDVGFCWLPLPEPDLYDWVTLVREPRQLAVSSDHELAARANVTLDDIGDLPLVALPAEAGVLRDFWLANDQRSVPATVAATASNADSALEIVSTGLGAALISAGNAEIYNRPGVTYVDVVDLTASELALVWRRDDRREVIDDATEVATALSTLSPTTRSNRDGTSPS